jgi:transposase
MMEPVGKKKPRRAFTPEFKAEIVELCQRGDRSLGQVARDFDLTETAVRAWVKQAELDAGVRSDGLTSAERDELAALRAENRRLRETTTSSNGPRFSSRGRPGERVPVHRGGERQHHRQRQACV